MRRASYRRRFVGSAATALMAATFVVPAALTASEITAAQAGAVTSQPPACPVPGSSVQPLYRDTQYSFAERAADLVSCMTLAEKLQQFSAGDNHFNSPSPAIPRLGVQRYTYWNEAQHGVYYLGENTNGNGTSQSAQATSFPTNLASTMTWDPQLVYQETTAIADEARGFLDKSLWGTGQNNLGPSSSDYGALTYWAPTINMDRDPRWGRTDEGFGEDPSLAGQMGDAYVDGMQGETPSGQPQTGYLEVAATAKHYAMNNVENSRTTGSSNTDDANVRDYYTAPFNSLVRDAHVSGVMTSFNAINGTPSPADTYTANELLQRTYGFNGYTTSDCGAVGDAASGHNWAPPGWITSSGTWTNTATGQQIPAGTGAQAWALRAGTDLNCTAASPTALQQALNAGVLSEGVLDNALVRVFTMRMETGEFDPPADVPYTKITKNVIQDPAHQALAHQLADESLVLLKNDNVAGTSHPLLPVDASKLNNVVIVGNMANQVQLGGYSGSPTHTSTPVQGITAAVKAANPGATITFDACGTSTTATTPASCSAATMAAAQSADLVIVYAGTDLNVAQEAHDRASLAMPGNYDSLISQVASVGNPRTALVLQANGPVDISDVQQDFPAIVFSGYNGQAQGQALADVLTGTQNPTGHLDFTWYKDDSQLPAMNNYGLTPAQTGGLGRTYMYFTGTPTYPFGYGLSYSHFAYSHVNVASRQVDANATVPVSFDVTNTGSVPGATVAQLYVAPQFTVPGVELPTKQLAGFQRTAVLAPGQTEHVTLMVKLASLSRWDENTLKQVVYDGAYQFQVGADSADIVAAPMIQVSGSIATHVQHVTVQPDQVEFTPGQQLDLTGKNPWIKDDTNPSLEQPHAPADNIVEAVNNDQSFADLSHANVSYSSSNPDVATVSPTGQVTAVARGAATVSVTVNGVTGSTPIIVNPPPLSLSAPSLVQPGSTLTATTTLPNASTQPLSNVSMSLSAPAGWTVAATTSATFASVPPGQTATTTWTITVPADAQPSTNELTATATFTDANGQDSSSAASSIAVPFPSLAAAFNNVGISDDANPSLGNIDGDGDSYSEQSLEAAGLSPGATVTEQGITYTWPDVPVGQPDNVEMSSQAITVNGSGSTLGFLGMAVGGTHTGTGTIAYSDGSTQTFTLTYNDWFADSTAGTSDQLVATALEHGSFIARHIVGVYAAEVPLQAGKTISAVTLPGDNMMHIFAIGVG